MRVLVACERSGIVREAFQARGHDAWSNDLVPADDGSRRHFRGDCLEFIRTHRWDLVIAHPPCTYLAVSGNRWHAGSHERDAAVEFVRTILDADVPRIAVENPISVLSTRLRKPDQYIQPWQFGHGEVKKTCLWLKGLKPLKATSIVEGRKERVWRMGPSPERSRLRGITYQGIANAMAEQWGEHADG